MFQTDLIQKLLGLLNNHNIYIFTWNERMSDA